MFFLFFQIDWFLGVLFLVLFFIFLHYLIIELQNFHPSYFAGIFLVAALFVSIFLGFDNIYLILSVALSHIAIIISSYMIYDSVVNKKSVKSISIFSSATSYFAIFSALSFASLFVANYQEFTLTCDDLETYSKKSIDYLLLNFDL